jgi:L-histidine Nalpha-methyltransferase
MTRAVQTALRAPRPTGAAARFTADVIVGLTATPKRLPPKYFYDSAGSALFDRITRLPEYYLTRSELGILRDHASAIASLFPPGCALIEFGSGSSRKARILLGAAATVEAYVPVDISGDFLRRDAAQLRCDFPHLSIYPLVADFTQPFGLAPAIASLPRVGFFPGSTIGNFEPRQAAEFLRHAGKMLGAGSLLVIGVDLIKDAEILYRAYNDAAGVTAQFNRNLLARINRELGADFNLAAFQHRAFYNGGQHRIEMHLASTRRQTVRVGGMAIEFRAGETIHTENSYKYTIDSFQALAAGSGWSPLKDWTDGLFCVFALRKTDDGGQMTDDRFSSPSVLCRPSSVV